MEKLDIRISHEKLKEILNRNIDKVLFDNLKSDNGYWSYENICLACEDSLYSVTNSYIVANVLDSPEEFANFQFDRVDNNEDDYMVKFKNTLNINSIVNKIYILNEHQIYKHENSHIYEVDLTRGILLDFEDTQLMIMKDPPDIMPYIYFDKEKRLFERFKNYPSDSYDDEDDGPTIDFTFTRGLIEIA